MTEPKYRYRIPPCPAYDIPGMEAWLEDMAAKGLHLAPDGFFCGVATFEEGAPRKERFRLEATATKSGLFSEEYEPEDDAVQMHREMGWVYRARRGQFHIYSSDDPEAPELNTDPQVQAITMAALTRYLRKSLFNTLFLLAFYAILYFGDNIVSGAILLGSWRAALLVGLILWDLGRQLRALAVLSGYRRQLQRCEPLPHRGSYRSRWYLAGGAARKALWLILIVAIMARVTEVDYVKLEDYTESFPFATLEDLYPGAQVERMDGFLHSQVYSWEDFLAPKNYDFSEYAEITYEGRTFDCYLTVEYFHTRWDWTARQLASELVSQSGANPIEQTMSKLSGEEPVAVTELILPDAVCTVTSSDDRDEPALVIQQNNIVLRVHLDVLGGRHDFSPEDLARLFLSQIR